MGLSIGTVAMLVVTFIITAIVGPIAIDTIVATTTTNWNAAVVTIFKTLLPILFIIGVAIKYIPRGKGE